MATIRQEKCRVAYTISGNAPEVMRGVEGAGQTYKSSTFLFMSASNRLRGLGTGAVGQADVILGVVGQALSDAGNRTNSTTEIPYLAVNLDTVFMANVISRFGTATSTLSIVHIGSAAGASCNSSRFFVSTRMVSASGSMVMVRAKHTQDAFGDTFGRVYFQFLPPAALWY